MTITNAYQGSMLMIVAPSGAGKSSLVNALLQSEPGLTISLSTTTRSPRPGEVDGKDYRFVTPEVFKQERDQGQFLEWAEVHGHFYGTSKTWIEQQMQTGSDVILEIDWQGAQQIRKLIPVVQWIFIFPPSIEALEERLRKRGQDEEATIERRLAAAHIELQHAHEANFIVINDAFDQALADLRHILAASRLRSGPVMARNPVLLKRLGV
ncbi:guanylate kinase [Polynucleobacter paneuropaeus]|jgi:guanylate kinase|uniref:Guanylate kinase n=1 Tax=Polynucleobacter paneuropaeus TaxID=2527775 RepID=A0A9Q2WIH2_9BURK|nr:guanylate kinase [Polynucleobacter paneuropaeus]AWW46314.1 guanylate kinase [Polynucleobacter paneuropaeus]AWW48153.1 guanylate kinase [Polynucleobacter paneuropaeus]MBT8514473.1 guanylate kinase [Polynucleobacter paneuropaeus]MBT8516312.1 guanylate kinase [Polynucleobacter paneuropaeus]MBT8518106.1 guanylate kinase [Polynucleobacter paneuropaeus]